MKVAKKYQPWDYYFIIDLLYEAIKQNRNYLVKHSIESKKTLKPKIKKMSKVIKLLKHMKKDNFLDLAENKLNRSLSDTTFDKTKKQDINDRKIYKKTIKLENKTYKKAFSMIAKQIRYWWE